jgi:hypothetical protein
VTSRYDREVEALINGGKAVPPLPAADPQEEAQAEAYVPKREQVATFPVEPPAKDEPRATTLRFIPISEFLTAVTAPDWLIRDVVETDSLVMIFGDPEAGKSFLAMDWAASVATGREWNGCKVKRGPVLYINGEGHKGVNRRFRAWEIANQEPLAASSLHVSTVSTALTDEVSRAELEAVLAEFIRAHGMPVLIVIDTLARNFGPGDENSTQDMTRAIATCDAIRAMTQATVALVHHSGHADKTRARGSMVLRGSLDAEYRMTRVEGSGDTTLEATKMKDAERHAPIAFRFASVELGVQDDEGREVTSAVLKRTEYVAHDEAPRAKGGRPGGGGKHLNTVMDTLNKLYSRAVRNVVADGRDASEAKVAAETWREACIGNGMHRNRFNESMAQLKAAGKVRFEYGFAYPMEDE